MTMYLDISLGPVQGFVSQSRRTRDLWGSSYLLSFLSGHAMFGVKKAGGHINRSVVENDPLYQWISGRRYGEPPNVGSLPNRFSVETDGEPTVVANATLSSFEAAWERICNTVWQEFVAHACDLGDGTQEIWIRQVEAFWETVWTAGMDEGGLLARRKHWRSHWPPDEPGDKCTVMSDMQELSGYVRSTGSSARNAQDHFWERIRQPVGKLDLRDNERLCAIALIKRLFPRVAEQALGWDVQRVHWSSTVHIAARPWLCRVEALKDSALAKDYAEKVKQFAPDGVLSERQTPKWMPDSSVTGDFYRLDANWFRHEAVENERLCPIEADNDQEARKTLLRKLKHLYNSKGQDGKRLGPPPAFYALLLADGDRLGQLVNRLGGECVSKALTRFVNDVPEIVDTHNGNTVYAGGDDVLAMLPITGAMACARELSRAYRNAFADTHTHSTATLSAAVVFSHIRLPLSQILSEAHRLLDSVAKERNGRDSLAVSVLKPGGPYCEWVTTWTRPDSGGETDAVSLVESLSRQLEVDRTSPGLSSALVYRIRDLLIRLCSREHWKPGSWDSFPKDIDIRACLHAEIDHSLAVRMENGAESRAKELTAIVWDLLKPARRSDTNGTTNDSENATVSQSGVDGVLLARFLADRKEQESV